MPIDQGSANPSHPKPKGGRGEPVFVQLVREFAVKYSVLVEESDEGFAVSVPGLPGCHSQGDTEAEALENIAEAIREYLEVAGSLTRSASGRPAEVEV